MGYNGASPAVGIPAVSPTFQDLRVTGTYTGPLPEVPTGGPAATAGSVSLIGGLATILTTAVTGVSLIYLSYGNNVAGGIGGPLQVTNVTPGASFDIAGALAPSPTVVNWFIIEPA